MWHSWRTQFGSFCLKQPVLQHNAPGVLPLEFGRLSQMEVLDVGRNQLEGERCSGLVECYAHGKTVSAEVHNALRLSASGFILYSSDKCQILFFFSLRQRW